MRRALQQHRASGWRIGLLGEMEAAYAARLPAELGVGDLGDARDMVVSFEDGTFSIRSTLRQLRNASKVSETLPACAEAGGDPAVIFAHAIEDEKPATSAGGFKGHVSLEDLKSRLGA